MANSAQNVVVAATGLLLEARIAESCGGVQAIAGGGDALRLRSELLDRATRGVRGIVSFGVAGALDPSLKAGQVIVASKVFAEHDSFQVNENWTSELRSALRDAQCSSVFATSRALTTARQKAEIFGATRCAAVDMESHIAGSVAAQLKLPFAVLRVIADEAQHDVPNAALAGMRTDGTTSVLGVIRELARQPNQLPQLLRLGAAAQKARTSLLGCVGRLGQGLSCVDIG